MMREQAAQRVQAFSQYNDVPTSFYPNQAAPYGSFPYADPTPSIWDSSPQRVRQDVEPQYRRSWMFNQEPIADTSAISSIQHLAATDPNLQGVTPTSMAQLGGPVTATRQGTDWADPDSTKFGTDQLSGAPVLSHDYMSRDLGLEPVSGYIDGMGMPIHTGLRYPGQRKTAFELSLQPTDYSTSWPEITDPTKPGGFFPWPRAEPTGQDAIDEMETTTGIDTFSSGFPSVSQETSGGGWRIGRGLRDTYATPGVQSPADINADMVEVSGAEPAFERFRPGEDLGMVDPTWGGQPGHMTTDAGAGMLALGLPLSLGAKIGTKVAPAVTGVDQSKRSLAAILAAILASPTVVTTGAKIGTRAKDAAKYVEHIFDDGSKVVAQVGKSFKDMIAARRAKGLSTNITKSIPKGKGFEAVLPGVPAVEEIISQAKAAPKGAIERAIARAQPAQPAGPSAADIQRDKQAAVDARNAAQARQAAINAQMAIEMAARQRQQQQAVAAEQARQAQAAQAAADAQAQAELARQVYADLMAGRDRGEPSAREVERAMERATQVDTFGHIGRQEQEAADRASVAMDRSDRSSGPR